MRRRTAPPIPLRRLTAGEQSALSYILDFYHRHHGRFPSLREQAREAGYSHQNAGLFRKALTAKGWLRLDPNGRGIMSAVQPLENYQTLTALDCPKEKP
ncbi:hypothetical protein UFOVP315_40 [uncultured Caudovirales phage]|uniref:LexA repressor DNA-binding domain-containing protein n=1 Tax=uncultured Caudovirales phage TaxID=2100421 RepID=A0A6J5LVB7_9CAUD|nr:hypothetical protein UFOVP315_40 [uncultured Caudovirales phage]